MASIIDKEFGIIALEGEILVRAFLPNKRFVAHQVLGVCWHPVLLLLLPFVVMVCMSSSYYHRYWLTNKRIIASSGTFGYRVQSMPLERITDVELRKSWLEETLGTSSLVIRDSSSGDGNIQLISIDDAPEIQMQILERIKRYS